MFQTYNPEAQGLISSLIDLHLTMFDDAYWANKMLLSSNSHNSLVKIYLDVSALAGGIL